MAIKLIGSNLNRLGDKGDFETDPSTWNLKSTPAFTYERSNRAAYKGLFCCKAKINIPYTGGGVFNLKFKIASYEAPPLDEGNIIVTCQVRAYADDVLKPSTEISLYAENTNNKKESAPINLSSLVASQQFQQLTLKIIGTPDSQDQGQEEIIVGIQFNIPGGQTAVGNLYIDDIKIHYYEEIIKKPIDKIPNIKYLFLARIPVKYSLQRSSENNAKNLYKRYIEVHTLQNNEFKLSMTATSPPNSEGICHFNLSPALLDKFDINPPPLHLTNEVKINNDRLLDYKVKYGDSYEGKIKPDKKDLTEDGIFRSIYAGVSNEKWREESDFRFYISNNLSWSTDEIIIDKSQFHILNYFHKFRNADSISAVFIFYDQNGNSRELKLNDKSTIVFTNMAYLLFSFNSISKLAVENNITFSIAKVKIAFIDKDADPHTYQTYRFGTPKLNSRYFMYLNSLGGWEVLRTYGRSKKTAKVKGKLVEHLLPINRSDEDFQLSIRNKTLEVKDQVSTGLLPDDRSVAIIQDFLLSNHIYEIINGVQYRRVNVQAPRITIADSEDYKRQVTFEVTSIYKEKIYTYR